MAVADMRAMRIAGKILVGNSEGRGYSWNPYTDGIIVQNKV